MAFLKMQLLLALIFVAHTTNAGPEGSDQYKGAQVLKLKLDTEAQKNLVGKLQRDGTIEIWKRFSNESVVDILAKSSAVKAIKRLLAKEKVGVQVMIADVAEEIKSQTPVAAKEESTNRKQSAKGRAGAKITATYNLTFTQYNRLSVIHGYLDFLATLYPTICTVQSIGTSILGNPIKVLKIAGKVNPANLSFVIEGGIHAREWISPAAVTYVIQQLVENRTSNAFAENLDFYVIPVTNPDGYEFSHTKTRLWRKNRRNATSTCPGVDLNRNFGYKWGGLGASTAKCAEDYRGVSAFSEPETLAVKNFVTRIGSSARGYISFHSYGQFILYPWGYDKVLANDTADLDKMGKKMAASIVSFGGPAYTVGNSAIKMYPASGTSDDFAKGGANIKYSYTIELRDKGAKGFLLPASQIVPTGKDAFAAVKTMAQELIAGA